LFPVFAEDAVKEALGIGAEVHKAEDTVERTIGALPVGTADHLLLVDDASPDGTIDLARRLGSDVRVHDRNRCFGGNPKTSYRKALDLGATVIVLLHSDYQYDLTVGSSFACTGNLRADRTPVYRCWGNRFITAVKNALLKTHSLRCTRGCRRTAGASWSRSPSSPTRTTLSSTPRSW
jgi:glycosyltransferase involved in cell wall biosynthesis